VAPFASAIERRVSTSADYAQDFTGEARTKIPEIVSGNLFLFRPVAAYKTAESTPYAVIQFQARTQAKFFSILRTSVSILSAGLK
jgi:hypothetical protein